MSEVKSSISDISVVAETTEELTLFLDSIGIELSVFGLQFSALIVAMAAFTLLLLAAWR